MGRSSTSFQKGYKPLWTKESREKLSQCLKGRKHSNETRKKMSDRMKGTTVPQSVRDKISLSLKGRKILNRKKPVPFSKEHLQNISLATKGEKNWKWVVDRTKLKTDRLQSYDYRYKLWMLAVKNRDGWKCKISNQDCRGRLEAHHILSWKDYPELRYQVNNGITLCCAHHPRKRIEEKQLSPYFQDLIIVKQGQ
jgi:hypothetical protein